LVKTGNVIKEIDAVSTCDGKVIDAMKRNVTMFNKKKNVLAPSRQLLNHGLGDLGNRYDDPFVIDQQSLIAGSWFVSRERLC
jgi:hypothetical protein